MRGCLLACALVLGGGARAGTGELPETGFRGLSVHQFERQCFGDGSVHYDPALATPRNDFIEDAGHPAGGWRVVLVGRIAADGPRYELRYDDGPSCDPTFSLWKEGADVALGEFAGDHLVMPGNGALYLIRRSNRAFESREKWLLRDGRLTEASQSHYYVGLDTRARRELQLLQRPAADAGVLATVPPAERVLIVLQQTVASRDWYLVRTPFGLVGWVRDDAYGEDRLFEDLQFLGD
ncbi:MAG: SH3 domain-containing protein [Xanthomonadales bacterium]|nr:hypothetical protein [Xanthomonadales bacterium]MCC6594000.1 SH3 domain-containing protein [Xanthomonadales bacterium]MCE7931652.1 SH3 domain-containing protein [Xanthomonadales bacterium PRO6]